MRSTITLNGQVSSEIEGLLIQSLPPISKPLMRTQIEEIEGRDGDIVTKLGFSSYTKEITIGLYGNFDINAIIKYFTSEGTVIFSNEPDKYYKYQILDQIDFERLIRFRTATVKMHCQPFKYSATEGTEVFSPSSNLLSFNDFTQTTNGVTLTASNGKITISGTPTTSTEFYLPLQNVNLAAGSYTLSATTNGTNDNYVSMRMIGSRPADSDSFGGKYITFVHNNTINLSATLDQSKSYGYLWFYMNAGTALNFDLTVRLENAEDAKISGEGSLISLQNTALAPFSKFDVKGDTAQQTYSGKNLWSLTKTETVNGISYTYNPDGTFNVVGTSTGSANSQVWVDVSKFVNGDTYTLSINKDIPEYVRILVQTYNVDTWQRVNYEIYGTKRTATGAINLTNGTRVLLTIRVNGAGRVVDIRNLSIQLEANSTATDFEPYVGGITAPNPDYPQEVQVVTGEQTVTITDGQGQSQEHTVNLGKNLFDLGDSLDDYFVTESAGTTISTNNDKSFVTVNFTENKWTTASYTTTGWKWCSKLLQLEKNTAYTVSGSANSALRIVGFNSLAAGTTGTLIKAVNAESGTPMPQTFDSGSYNYYAISLYPGEGENAHYFENIQIEKGSTATTYAPYFTPIELCKIGDYQDYIYKSGDDWYVRKETGSIKMADITSWGNNGSGSFYKLAFSRTYNAAIGQCLANIFVYNNTAWAGNGKFGITADGNLWIMTGNTSITVDTVSAWLSDKNAIMYYALATPTDTKITDTTLIEQLNALVTTAHAYKGTTNLESTSENVPHIMAVEVAKDTTATITNSGNTTAKPVMTIYGSGTIGIYLNGYQIFTVNLGDNGYITIDTANMEAYKDTTDNLMNRLVDGDYSNFALQTGDNQITFSGTVTKLEISNYSRWI